jgi:hypothetical protein
MSKLKTWTLIEILHHYDCLQKMLFEFEIGTLMLTRGNSCVMNSSMNSTISTFGAFKNGGIAQIFISFMHSAHPLLNCALPLPNCAHPLPNCAFPLSNSTQCSFSTLSPSPNDMIHPPMMTFFYPQVRTVQGSLPPCRVGTILGPSIGP